MSGLKINVSKSRIFGIGIPEEEVQTWARSVGCGYGSLPFTYLGLPVGTSMKRGGERIRESEVQRFLGRGERE